MVSRKLARLKFILIKLDSMRTKEGSEIVRDAGISCVQEIADALKLTIPDTGFDQGIVNRNKSLEEIYEAVIPEVFTVSPYVVRKICRLTLEFLNDGKEV